MKRINRVQRLARREEKDIVKRIFFLSVVSIILIFFLLTVGITALGKLAELTDAIFKPDEKTVSEKVALTPPILDTDSDVVNNEKIKITGFSSSGSRVEIFSNAAKVGDAVLESGRFEYELMLQKGENEVNVKTLDDLGNASELSTSIIITFDSTEPKLEVTSPTDGQSFYSNNRVPVEGMAEVDAEVFVNGFLANISADGSFDTTIPLPEGDSEIEVKAVDSAGNEKLLKIKVNFRK